MPQKRHSEENDKVSHMTVPVPGVTRKNPRGYYPSNASNATLAQKILWHLSLATEPVAGPYYAELFHEDKDKVRKLLNRLHQANKIAPASKIGRAQTWSYKSEEGKAQPTTEKAPWPIEKAFWQPGEPLYLHKILWFHAKGVSRFSKHGIKTSHTRPSPYNRRAIHRNFSPTTRISWKTAKTGSIDLRITCEDRGLDATQLNEVVQFIEKETGIPARSFIEDRDWRWFGVGFRNRLGLPWFSGQKTTSSPQFGVISVKLGAEWYCQLYEKKFLDGTRELVRDWHYEDKPSLAPAIQDFPDFIQDWNRAVTQGKDTWELLQEVKSWSGRFDSLSQLVDENHQQMLQVISENSDVQRALTEKLDILATAQQGVSEALHDLADFLARNERLKGEE